VSRFYQSTGTLLERNGIQFKEQVVEPRTGWKDAWNGLFDDKKNAEQK